MSAADFLPASFFQWCMNAHVSKAINESLWLFAVIETVHIVALTVLLGTMLVVDLRLLGIGMHRQSAPELAREVGPWTVSAIAAIVFTGVPMFASQAVRYSHSVPFLYKIVLLLTAIALHFTLHRKATQSEAARLGKLAAGLSLACWFGVALAGRAIAFL
jgi:hypothetical protein